MKRKIGNRNVKKIFDMMNDNKKKEFRYKQIELILIAIYVIATAVIAYSAFTQLPDIAKSLKQPKIIVDINNYVKDDYIPIGVFNAGEGPATNLTILVKSCDMDNPIPYSIGKLYPNQRHDIQFKHEKTLKNFKKIDCHSAYNYNFSLYETEIVVYKNKTNGDFLSPPINKTIDVCGYCTWQINITMDQGKQYETDKTFSPIQLSFFKEGDKFDVKNPNIVYYSAIKVSFFSEETLKKLTGAS